MDYSLDSYKILRKDEIKGGLIMELIEGEYQNKMYLETSLYFREGDFWFFEDFVVKVIPEYANYGHYGITTIKRQEWMEIERLIFAFIDSLKDPADLNRYENFYLEKLIRMLEKDFSYKNEFTIFVNDVMNWVKHAMDQRGCISIIGI